MHPALRPYVASVTAYDVTGEPGVHRGLPGTSLTFVLPVDQPLDVGWAGVEASRAARWSTVSGLHSHPAARRDAPRPRAAVARALARLTRGVAVQEVASDVGYSRRRLSTLVREECGLTPKEYQRVARFEASRELVERRPLAEVAARCGYADQAHLTREWTALAGCAPTTWLREEFPFVQDPDGTAPAG